MQLLPLNSFLPKKLLLSAVVIVCVYTFSACSSPKSITYFNTLNKDTTLQGFITDTYESKIQKKDVLAITVSSLNKEMDEVFNNAVSDVNETATAGPKPAAGFVVDEKGNILIHMLGSVHVEGLSRNELKQKLQKELLPYMKEPIVGVQYLNHKITVIGFVERPQVITLTGEQMPLLDALVTSGDLKDVAKRDDIMIIREQGDQKQIKHINLQDQSLFSSPWYYLQSNDIVYVMPDKNRSDKDEKRRTLQTTMALIASGVSLLLIIINNFIK